MTTNIHSATEQTLAALRSACHKANPIQGTWIIAVTATVPLPGHPTDPAVRTAEATNEQGLSSDIVATDDQGRELVSLINMATREHWHLAVQHIVDANHFTLTVQPLPHARS